MVQVVAVRAAIARVAPVGCGPVVVPRAVRADDARVVRAGYGSTELCYADACATGAKLKRAISDARKSGARWG